MVDTRLKTLLTLLEEKNYTSTAKKLYITQPAVTHHIKSLEKDANITLFSNSKTFELTSAGEVLVKYAKNAIEQYSLLENSLAKTLKEAVCTVAFTPFTKDILDNFGITTFFKRQEAKLNIMIEKYDNIIEGLVDGTIDFAIIDNNFDGSIFESYSLFSSKLKLVCKAYGNYGSKDRITREQLKNAPLVLAEKSSGLYKSTINSLHSKNINIKDNDILYTNCNDWLVNLVIINDAISVMYEDSMSTYIDKGLIKPIELLNFNFSQNVYLIYSRNAYLSDNIKKLIDNLKKYME